MWLRATRNPDGKVNEFGLNSKSITLVFRVMEAAWIEEMFLNIYIFEPYFSGWYRK